MKAFLKATAVAIALAGSAMFAAPAQADGFSISIGPGGGISFSLNTGGYCDRWGCPDEFWDLPVYYCPVYYDGQWFRGPVYYREWRGRHLFYVHGQWRPDQWRGRRPAWACEGRYGPALGFDFYDSHGFQLRDEWRE